SPKVSSLCLRQRQMNLIIYAFGEKLSSLIVTVLLSVLNSLPTYHLNPWK
ncbi:hypothetical protein MKX03_010706, partial [Papaver bracteatum]